MRMPSSCGGSGTVCIVEYIVQEGAIEVTVNYVAITVITDWSSATGNYCKTIQSVNSSEMGGGLVRWCCIASSYALMLLRINRPQSMSWAVKVSNLHSIVLRSDYILFYCFLHPIPRE